MRTYLPDSMIPSPDRPKRNCSTLLRNVGHAWLGVSCKLAVLLLPRMEAQEVHMTVLRLFAQCQHPAYNGQNKTQKWLVCKHPAKSMVHMLSELKPYL